MSGRRRAVHVCAVVLAMFDAMRRTFHLIFGKPQPIEWWLLAADLAIVFLIIWLDVPETWHKRSIGKHLTSLSGFVDNGLRLQRSVPDSSRQ